MLCLIDTGASVSCLSSEFLATLNIDSSTILPPDNSITVRGAGSQVINVLGKIILPLRLIDNLYLQEFHIIEQLIVPILLGLDFAITHGAKLDFMESTLTLSDNTYFFPYSETQIFDGRCAVQIIESIIIPPLTETLLPVTLSDSFEIYSMTGMLEPCPGLFSNWGIITARALVTINENKTVCRLLNPHQHQIYLPVSTRLAYFHDVSYVEDNELLDDNDKFICVLDLTNGDTSSNALEEINQMGIDLSHSDLQENDKRELAKFLLKNKDLFAKDVSELELANVPPLKIHVQNTQPISQRAYRVSPDKRIEIQKQIQEMLDNNIIVRSDTLWTSPCLLVKKANGTWRLVIDYRKINNISRAFNHPLPLLRDAVNILRNKKIFTSIDLANAYWQLPLSKESQEYTGFINHMGVFAFKRCPYGLKQSAGYFQSTLERVLAGLVGDCLLCYVDDILVFSENLSDHLNNLSKIFARLRNARLKLKPSKCNFGAKEVHYLGHIVSKEGIKADPAKSKAVDEFPIPKSTTDVRAFLGLSGFYRTFVRGYANIAAPLNNLLKEE